MRSDRIAAWLVLLIAGTTMVSYNLWHGFHSGMPGYLALLDGTVPVLLALGLSHMVARRGRFLKTVTILVMLGAMVLSIRATGYGVSRATGNLWWLFGLVVDAAALVALQVILTPAAKAAASDQDDTSAVTPAVAVPHDDTTVVTAHANGNGNGGAVTRKPTNQELADAAGVSLRTFYRQQRKNGAAKGPSHS